MPPPPNAAASQMGTFIPPLASSSTSLAFNKENDERSHRVGWKSNDKPTESHSRLGQMTTTSRHPSAPTSMTKRQPLGLLTPQQPSEPIETQKPQSATSRPYVEGALYRSSPASAKTPRRVLRSGETIESTFCFALHALRGTSAEYTRICRDIVEGTLAEDTSAWRQVLELTADVVTTFSAIEHKDALIELHRRATMRFSIDSHPSTPARQDILAMLILYAKLQERLGSIDDARATYRRIQKQPLPLGGDFFIAYANMEIGSGHRERAKEILRLGIAFEEVADKLKSLEAAQDEKKNNQPLQSLQSIVPPLPPRKENNFRSPPLLENKPMQTPEQLPGGSQLMSESERRRNFSRPNDVVGEGVDRMKSPFLSDDSSTQSTNWRESPALGHARVKISSRPAQVAISSASKRSAGELPNRSKRSKLSSRLTRVGLSGRAKRVDPDASFIGNDESDSEKETQPMSSTAEVTEKAQNFNIEAPAREKSTAKKVSKVTKLDLNYMWEWDPNSRSGGGDKTDRLSNQKVMEKIEETSTNASSTADSAGTAQTSNSATISSQRSSDQKSTASNESVKSGHSKRLSSESHNHGESNEKLQGQSLASTVNPKFLPLVTENNILTVNDTPYAKLGVIGKGGSCKVYRALSETCSVLAIKKVKLEGMDKKAIEGYANEISLLKRLRGNPSIIEMYDSEVDLERKSIFVVMELGEVDLNYVLKQRAMSSTEANSRSLNMNFIRLTWQQMLSAVHCIHEERIIHSDLKPANFLFVRGSLKLIDFGIAKAIQSDETTNIYRDSAIGTVNYMAPEAILDSGTSEDGPRMKLGRVSV